MTHSSSVDAVLRFLAGEREGLPEDYNPPDPCTEAAASLLSAIQTERLYHASSEILAGRGVALAPTVLALLHHIGRQAVSRGLQTDAAEAIGRLVKHEPNNLGARLWLVTVLSGPESASRIVELLEPFLEDLFRHPQSFAPHFRILANAAYECRRIDLINAIAPHRPPRNFHGHAALDAIYKRAADLAILGITSVELAEMTPQISEAMLTLDEYGLIDRLDAVDRIEGEVSPLRSRLVLASLARMNCWGRAYRKSLALARRRLGSFGDLERVRPQWEALMLPPEGFEAFLMLDARPRPTGPADADLARLTFVGEPDSKLECAVAAFADAPTIEAAEQVWKAAYRAGQHELLARYAPSGHQDANIAGARAVVHAPPERGGEPPLWILMTWLAGADRVLRVLAAYVGQATVVLSIGGDGAPKDLSRVSALLLAENVHILSRPVVTWGGQQGAYYNFLEVMEAFLSATPEDAWLATACDRTYPLQNLQRLQKRTAEQRSLKMHFGFGPPAWKAEWTDDVVKNLAERYHSAIEEIFRTGKSTEFYELATKSPLYGDDPTFRLHAAVFNFSNQPANVNPGFWHDYMISPFEADMRWMSFARLQAFVELGAETRTTYSRRHHPLMTRWIQEELSRLDLRNGTPWAHMSHRYIEAVLTHPELPKIFSAFSLGFAPEMNFFDTMGASLRLDSEYAHLFHVFNGEDALDSELPAACISADRDEFAFIRKTNPQRGANLIGFFAHRIFEDETDRTLNWAILENDPKSDLGDPRPVLDFQLLDRLFGVRVSIRDLFGQHPSHGRFMPDGRIVGRDGEILAAWTFDGRELQVIHLAGPGSLSVNYRLIGGANHVLTLVPAALVGAGVDWGLFLDFDLSDLGSDPAVHCLAALPDIVSFAAAGRWIGAGLADVALLTAFSDPGASNFPTPTVEAEGAVHEIRAADGRFLLLATIAGFPTFLTLSGFAYGCGRTVLELERASAAQVAAWNQATPCTAVEDRLQPSSLPGRWKLETLYGSRTLRLREDNWIVDEEDEVIGRWIVRADGLQLVGLEEMVIGLASQYRKKQNGWRLSGWGWRNIKDSVSFSLTQFSV